MPDIDFGRISESLNEKTDRDLRNVDTTAKADAVIDYQEPTSANNYTWYRKYKSGWVEQGVRVSASVTSVSLPIEMSNSDYWSMINFYKASSNNSPTTSGLSAISQTTTSFTTGSSGYTRVWIVRGMAAN